MARWTTTASVIASAGVVACLLGFMAMSNPNMIRSTMLWDDAHGGDGLTHTSVCCRRDVEHTDEGDGSLYFIIPTWCNELHLGGALAPRQLQDLVNAIQHDDHFQVLKLHENGLGDAGAATIAEALKVNHHLKWIDLESNKITDVGAASIADALAVNMGLNWLDLAHNGITNAGAQLIVDALKANKHSTLARLDTEDNEEMTNDLHALIDEATAAGASRVFGYFKPPTAEDMSATEFCHMPVE